MISCVAAFILVMVVRRHFILVHIITSGYCSGIHVWTSYQRIRGRLVTHSLSLQQTILRPTQRMSAGSSVAGYRKSGEGIIIIIIFSQLIMKFTVLFVFLVK